MNLCHWNNLNLLPKKVWLNHGAVPRSQGTVSARIDLPTLTFLLYNVSNLQYAFLTSREFITVFLIFFIILTNRLQHWKREWVGHGNFGLMQKDYGENDERTLDAGEGLCTGSPWLGIRAPRRFIKAQQFAPNLSTYWVSMFAERTLLPKKCLKSLHYIFQFIQIPQSFKTMLGKSRKETLPC